MILEFIKFSGFVLMALITAWTFEVYVKNGDLRFLRTAIFAMFLTVYTMGMLIAGR
jgi:hypothetical protein